MTTKIMKYLRVISVFIFTLLFGTYAYAVETASPANPNWGLDPIQGTLLQPGIATHTIGTVNPPGTDGTNSDADHVFKLYDTRGTTPTDARPLLDPDEHTHHQWDIGSMGNVYGLAIDMNRNIYATASATYGTGYYGGSGGNSVAAIVGFGEIGAGTTTEAGNNTDGDTPVTNSTAAAGTIYKIDSITGETTVFAQLPQQAFSYSNSACEINNQPDLVRNTGPALGNIAYDPVHNQFFVSNFEDGRIYRLDINGTVLNSFDPFAADDGTAGLAPDVRPFGLAVNADGTALYFGTHELNLQPRLFAVNLDATGNFTGSEIDQNAQYGVDITETLNEGAGYAANPHVAYSDLQFTPDGKLVVGTRVGCENNFATSYNHGGTYLLLEQSGTGLYDTTATEVPGGTTAGGNTYDAGTIPTRFINDTNGPDEGMEVLLFMIKVRESMTIF